MTLPLSLQITDDIAWFALIGLFVTYFYRSGKKSGQWDRHCPICKLEVNKIKSNNSRYLKLVAHDKFTWRNPLAFYQTYYFCSIEHLQIWVNERLDQLQGIKVLDKPTVILPSDFEDELLDQLGSKEPLSDN